LETLWTTISSITTWSDTFLKKFIGDFTPKNLLELSISSPSLSGKPIGQSRKSLLSFKSMTQRGGEKMEAICRTLTGLLYVAPNDKERLRIIMQDWGFALPMASAILSVGWPDDFTVYDYRVRVLVGCPELNNLTDFERIWEGFKNYKAKVSEMAPSDLNVRDKDRYLWGHSTASQLEEDIQRYSKL
jgi:hypothetical protein